MKDLLQSLITDVWKECIFDQRSEHCLCFNHLQSSHEGDNLIEHGARNKKKAQPRGREQREEDDGGRKKTKQKEYTEAYQLSISGLVRFSVFFAPEMLEPLSMVLKQATVLLLYLFLHALLYVFAASTYAAGAQK